MLCRHFVGIEQGWFDLYDWPIEVGAKDDPVGLQRSVGQVQEEVARLGREEGIPPHKIVLGGFSQGGAVALLACYHPTMSAGAGAMGHGPYAGCVGLSAWLTLPDQVAGESESGDATAAADDDARLRTPLFWGHGTYDDKVLFEQQAFGVERLRRIGVDVTAREYPVDHSAHPGEMQDFAAFVDRAIFGGLEEGSSAAAEPQEAASAKNEL
jgi:predicted esterase